MKEKLRYIHPYFKNQEKYFKEYPLKQIHSYIIQTLLVVFVLIYVQTWNPSLQIIYIYKKPKL